jgi:hypothetical protein
METLAIETCISKRTVQRRLQELAEMGFIEIIPQRSEAGRQANNLYRITGGQSVTLAPPGGQIMHPDGQNEQPRVTLMSTNKGIDSIGGNNTRARRAGVSDKIDYSEEFETEVWKPYPRKTGTSKKKAWDHWRMLTEQQQQQVKATIPVYAAQMKREGRSEEKIKWLAHFISERIYETLVAAPAVPRAAGSAGRPFWETATRQQWIDALWLWQTNWNWKKEWGPEPENPMRPNPPGAPKHHVPQDILDRFDLRYRGHMYSPEQKAEIQVRVDAASKHAVDKDRAA